MYEIFEKLEDTAEDKSSDHTKKNIKSGTTAFKEQGGTEALMKVLEKKREKHRTPTSCRSC